MVVMHIMWSGASDGREGGVRGRTDGRDGRTDGMDGVSSAPCASRRECGVDKQKHKAINGNKTIQKLTTHGKSSCDGMTGRSAFSIRALCPTSRRFAPKPRPRPFFECIGNA